MIRRIAELLVVGAALSTLWSCSAMAPRSELFKEVGGIKTSPSALRIEVRGLAPRFSGLLEAMADEVVRKSPDVETRAAMTRFKINALPSMQAALFQPDPVAALIDAWALLVQMQDAIEAHPAAANPELEAFVRDRVGAMESELQGIWRDMTGRDGDEAYRRIHVWAAENPLTEGLAARQSTAGLLANVTAQAGVSPLRAASVLLEDTRDLSARLDLLAAYLPKQARWQVESMAYQAILDPELHEQGERLATVLARARGELEGFVDQERVAIEEMIDRQRVQTVGDIEQVGRRLIDHASAQATSLIVKGMVGALGLAAACTGLALLARVAWRRL